MERSPAFSNLTVNVPASQWQEQSATMLRLQGDLKRVDALHAQLGIAALRYDIALDRLEPCGQAHHFADRQAFASIQSLSHWLDPEDADPLMGLLGTGECDGDTFTIERRVTLSNGAARWLRMNGIVTRSRGVPVSWYATLQDITEWHEAVTVARTAVEQDRLTGVYSRSVFADHLRRAIDVADAEDCIAGLMLIDVDGFSAINAEAGHAVGDEVLRFLGRCLVSMVRRSDVVVRLSADEFAIILYRANSADGLSLQAERIAGVLRGPIRALGRQIDLSCSVGLAIYPDDVTGGIDLHRAAENALAETKRASRGRVCRFDRSLRERRDQHRALIARVGEGIERNEFAPHFQPKIDLTSGVSVGFEALLRWHHPERGVLCPGAFYAALEDAEIGARLSDVSLRCAFETARFWSEKRLHFGHISINLNAQQMERTTLLAQVNALRERFGVAPDQIVFEVLETVLIRDRPVVYENLKRLAGEGFRVSLDDFGTGFASLAHIREPFIREVKVDRSFVTHTAHCNQDRQIVAAIVQMARKLKLTMVAEGIEDEETLRQLRGIGCTVGQGFVFAPALSLAAATVFIERQSRIADLLARVPPSLTAIER